MSTSVAIGFGLLGAGVPELDAGTVVGAFLIWSLVAGGQLLVVLAPVFLILSAPMRRQERAAILLDLVEAGLKDGKTPEETVSGVAAGVHRALGVKFLMLATIVQEGFRLGAALERVPGIVPRPFRAMLQVGEEEGDVARVLPACRAVLRDAGGQVRGMVNYLPALLLYLVPTQVVVVGFILVYVLPKFRAIAADMGLAMPAYAEFAFRGMEWFLPLAAAITVLMLLGLAVYILTGVYGVRLPGGTLLDRLALCLPWRRRRVRRDFCAMLSLLLDAGVAEERAVELAAKGTGNQIFVKGAAEVRRDLAAGTGLTEALKRLESAGEFHWRFANAAHGDAGFWESLAGWREALDAKAFQLEQSASQLIASSAVVASGVIVGLLATGIFAVLIGLIEEGLLW